MENGMKPSYDQGEHGSVPMLFCISVGFSFFWMLFLVGILNTSVTQMLAFPGSTLALTPAAVCVGLVIANVVTFLKCDFFSTESGNAILTVASVVGPLVSSTVLVLDLVLCIRPPMPIVCAAWIIMGIGIGSLLAIWSEILEGFTKKFSSRAAAFSTIIGTVLYFITCNLSPFLSIGAVCLAAPASLALQYFLRKEIPPIEFVSRAESLKRHKLTKPIDALNTLYSVAFGLAICTLSKAPSTALMFGGIALAIVAGALIMVPLFEKNSDKMMHGPVQRKIFPILVIGLLPIPFVGDELKTACMLIILVGYICLMLVNLDSLYLLTKKYHVGALYLIGRGQSPIFVGLAIGYILGYISTTSGAAGGNLLSIISLVLVIVLSISVSVIDFDKDHLEDERTPQRTPAQMVEIASAKMPWKSKCASVAARFNLSTREVEVFNLLAKGRGTTYIQEKLYISPHTVKTHVYKIYKKIGISSREELITLIEEEPIDNDLAESPSVSTKDRASS